MNNKASLESLTNMPLLRRGGKKNQPLVKLQTLQWAIVKPSDLSSTATQTKSCHAHDGTKFCD